MKLLTVGANTKINKSDAFGGYLTAILHLAPANLSGYQVCPWSSEGCRAACLNSAGRGRFTNVQAARIRKTKMFFEDRAAFMDTLIKDIESLIRKCKKLGVSPVVRLNGTSDILWERIPIPCKGSATGFKTIFQLFPEVQFYDYTKAPYEKRKGRDNYTIIYSRADDSQKPDLLRALHAGERIAAVFYGELPKYFWGYPVVDGDKTDLRFLDPKGCVIGLSAKGNAKTDNSGFVIKAA